MRLRLWKVLQTGYGDVFSRRLAFKSPAPPSFPAEPKNPEGRAEVRFSVPVFLFLVGDGCEEIKVRSWKEGGETEGSHFCSLAKM